jgi:hypothetical protein
MTWRACVLLMLLVRLLTACAGADDLKPGIARGVQEDGFEKTTEGLSLTVHDRTVDDVWTAAMRGVQTVVQSDASSRIVEERRPAMIKLERKDFLGWFPQSYMGIFLKPVERAIVIEVSKINWGRMQVTEFGPTEGDYLRAIQRELGAAK